MIDGVFKVLKDIVTRTDPVGAPFAPARPVDDVSFGDVFQQVVLDARDSLKIGEAASIAGLSGKASAQEVTEAMMAAELTLNSATAIRDKMVGAYNDITRMPI